MNTLLNILWFIFGGLITGLGYILSSLVLIITIIGIPFGLQTMKLATLAFFPFGKEIIHTEKSTGCLSLFMNILWILCGGIWISISHLVFGIILCISVIGIPFGLQHFKLASLALAPFGVEIRYK